MASELLALLHVAGCEVERALGDAERLRADERPRAVERTHRVREPLTGLADEVLRRYCALVEDDLTRGRPSDAHLVLELRHREPGEVLLDDEAADPAVTGVGIGLGEHRVEVADARVGDPELAARQHVVVAVPHGLGAHAGDVAARVGLRKAVRRLALAARDPRDVLRARAPSPPWSRTGVIASFEMKVNSDDDAQTRADLLHADRVGEEPAALTTELLGERETREPGLAPSVPRVPRVFLVLVGMRGVRRDLVLGETPDRRPQLREVVGQGETGQRPAFRRDDPAASPTPRARAAMRATLRSRRRPGRPACAATCRAPRRRARAAGGSRGPHRAPARSALLTKASLALPSYPSTARARSMSPITGARPNCAARLPAISATTATASAACSNGPSRNRSLARWASVYA